MLDKTVAYGLDFLFPAADKTVGPCLVQYGEFSKVLLDLFVAMSADFGPSTMIDVGANIGSISLPFAKQCPEWSVVAIEAHRGIAGILSANALNNKLYNVEVINAAAGQMRGIVDFPATSLTESINWGTVGFDHQSSKMTPTAMITLDEIAPGNTRLIKIDVENFEPQVLSGAGRLLAEHKVAWLVEAAVNFPKTSLETVRIFLDAGYAVHWFYVPFATPTSKKNKPIQARTGDANILALPTGSNNIWNLPRIRTAADSRPSSTKDYPYLSSYGYT